MYEVIVKGRFSAAHKIEGYRGDCANLHGHNWTVEVRFGCEKTNDIGISFDFSEAKRILGSVLSSFDHSFLNENTAMEGNPPTSENIAKAIFKAITRKLPSDIILIEVILWESDVAGVVYRE